MSAQEWPTDKTALSFWFPRLEAAGLPVPRTKIIKMPQEAQASIWAIFDGKEDGNPKAFFDEIAAAGAEFGFPCFLRTDQTSGKHNWEETCFLPSADDIPQHVFKIAEFSEMCDFMGLPWHTWAVRELLPTVPFGICPRYGKMPICREFRFFVDDGAVRCGHPYWPLSSLEQGGAEADIDFAELCRMADEESLRDLAAAAGRAVGGGSWSIDLLETARGWYVTDMAEAHKSFHWPDCPFDFRGQARAG